jgi:NAD(P)-dependent dehydrogenase (short-subunit alcohol dehydrogenase family)
MSGLRLRLGPALEAVRAPLEAAGATGLVFGAAGDPPGGYAAVEDELVEAFRLSREAAAAGDPIVYVLSQPELLGGRGATAAMRAGALLSAMRALALEGARDGLRVNALAVGDEPDPERVAAWAALLLREPGVSGELVRVDAAHAGKLVP